MTLLGIPRSGRDGGFVYYMRGKKLCRRRYVVPKNVRTAGRGRARGAFGAIAKAWSRVLTEEQRRGFGAVPGFGPESGARAKGAGTAERTARRRPKVTAMSFFRKDTPPAEDLANLKVTDARTGDVISISGVGKNFKDLDFTEI